MKNMKKLMLSIYITILCLIWLGNNFIALWEENFYYANDKEVFNNRKWGNMDTDFWLTIKNNSVDPTDSLLNRALKIFNLNNEERYSGPKKALAYAIYLLNYALWFVAFIALCLLMYSFYCVVVGNEKQIDKAKAYMKWIAIAIVVMWLSRLIVSLIFWLYDDVAKEPNSTLTLIQEAQFNTENMLPISEIKDWYLILKDWGIRAILKAEGINLDLKNFDEIQSTLEQYKRFLNWLEFPLQFLVRNTYLDLREYLNYVKNNVEKLDPGALKEQGKDYEEFLENINMKQGLIYVKEFYVVIPYYDNDTDSDQVKKPRWSKFMDTLNSKDDVENIISRYRTFVKWQKMLNTRVSLVQEGLWSLWVRTELLNTKEVISLLFSMYNPLLDSTQWDYNGD